MVYTSKWTRLGENEERVTAGSIIIDEKAYLLKKRETVARRDTQEEESGTA